MKLNTAILILNYNNYEDTINCIESIEKHNTSDVKYFVVDNASPRKETVQKLDEYFLGRFKDDYVSLVGNDKTLCKYPYVSFIRNKINGGYAYGNNIGIKHALADSSIGYIMVINNDVLFFEDIIDNLKISINSLPNCGLVSPVLYKKDKQGYDYNCARLNITNKDLILTYLLFEEKWFGVKQKNTDKRKILLNSPSLLKEDSVKIELPSGSCMIAKSDVWSKINGFDEGTFLYFEENVLFKKLQKIGLCNYLTPKVGCIHLGASSISKVVSYDQSKRKFKSMMYYAFNYAEFNLAQRIFFKAICWMNLFAIKAFYTIKK